MASSDNSVTGFSVPDPPSIDNIPNEEEICFKRASKFQDLEDTDLRTRYMGQLICKFQSNTISIQKDIGISTCSTITIHHTFMPKGFMCLDNEPNQMDTEVGVPKTLFLARKVLFDSCNADQDILKHVNTRDKTWVYESDIEIKAIVVMNVIDAKSTKHTFESTESEGNGREECSNK
ncbi:hypothetical protein AVEN_124424-1 [Araneus ventricosus]|uniref:Uncharacterized protein n=1 Tax=Araneus ventricosus TaxID=182803 RepID=A0A4Y2KC17_ARAVE|nr:hypothetical protein AVEN_124424-1 [Araneus ventricosus]